MFQPRMFQKEWVHVSRSKEAARENAIGLENKTN